MTGTDPDVGGIDVFTEFDDLEFDAVFDRAAEAEIGGEWIRFLSREDLGQDALSEEDCEEEGMQVDVRINGDDTQVAIHFPDIPPGFTLYFEAEELEDFIGILIDVRQRMRPPPALPGEMPIDEDED